MAEERALDPKEFESEADAKTAMDRTAKEAGYWRRKTDG